MMNRYRKQQGCLFSACQATPTIKQHLSPARSQNYSHKIEKTSLKTSLKKILSKQSLLRPIITSPPLSTNRLSLPLSTPKRQFIQITKTSVRPTIRFSWGKDLEQTKKKEQIQQPSSPIKSENPLQKTKPINKINNLNDHPLLSLISIPDSTPKGQPRVEQSVIMVDYFNPNNQQIHRLEQYLKDKGEQKP